MKPKDTDFAERRNAARDAKMASLISPPPQLTERKTPPAAIVNLPVTYVSLDEARAYCARVRPSARPFPDAEITATFLKPKRLLECFVDLLALAWPL